MSEATMNETPVTPYGSHHQLLRIQSRLSMILAGSSTLAALRNPRLLRTEIFAGIVTALALIPETISFSILAGVGPEVGLYTSFIFVMVISIVGGRPGMVSAAAGSIALVVAPLVAEHGVEYLIAAVLVGGLLQVLLAAAGVAKLMRFVPHSVMTGFVNALAILIFSAQIPHLIGVPWLVYPMVAIGLLIMILLPRVTTVIPAQLVATAVLTVASVAFALSVPSVGDEGEFSSALPALGIPAVPFTLGTLTIIAPYAVAIALVGLMETLITQQLVDEITDTRSDPRRESWGQGVSNMVTGFFGGMGGCAMIGQTMMNVKTCGARTRISSFVAGLTLLSLVVFFQPVLVAIPMAALVAVMVMVSVATMDWRSLSPSTLRRLPVSETSTMLVTVAITVATHNLAYGVIVGVLCAMVVFIYRLGGVIDVDAVDSVDAHDGRAERTYHISGHLFFAASGTLAESLDYLRDPDRVTIDLTRSHLWDATTVATLDKISDRYAALGKSATIVGLNTPSSALLSRLTQSDVLRAAGPRNEAVL